MPIIFSLIIAILSFVSIPVYADDLIVSVTKTSFIGNVIDPTMLDSEQGALPESGISQNQPISQQVPMIETSVPLVSQAQVAIPQEVVESKTSITSYSGKLVKAAKKKGDTLHRYYVTLADGDKLSLQTQRNYDEFVGKNIAITIQGTKKNFKILSFEGAGLIKSGPENMLVLAGFLAMVGGIVRRKITN